jgi:hypothetical protein
MFPLKESLYIPQRQGLRKLSDQKIADALRKFGMRVRSRQGSIKRLQVVNLPFLAGRFLLHFSINRNLRASFVRTRRSMSIPHLVMIPVGERPNDKPGPSKAVDPIANGVQQFGLYPIYR